MIKVSVVSDRVTVLLGYSMLYWSLYSFLFYHFTRESHFDRGSSFSIELEGSL